MVLRKLFSLNHSKFVFCRFTEESDKEWFIRCLKDTVSKDLGDDFQYYTDEEVFWVDFLREVPEATGDEPEDFVFEAPKVYEEIPSWEFLKEKLLSEFFILHMNTIHLSFEQFLLKNEFFIKL